LAFRFSVDIRAGNIKLPFNESKWAGDRPETDRGSGRSRPRSLGVAKAASIIGRAIFSEEADDVLSDRRQSGTPHDGK
jgi:hypothetical protein